jgi:hypothetical protein
MDWPQRYCLFSIDTEPDDPLWRGIGRSPLSYRNSAGISRLCELTKEYGIRPTFLVTYSMARHPAVADILGKELAAGSCEAGLHFHPGDTPPFANDQRDPDNICRVPDGLLEEKFHAAHECVAQVFGRPASYRSAAWALDGRIIRLLRGAGYAVDSSVTPGISWRLIGRPSYVRAPARAYQLDAADACREGTSGILELPVTVWSRKQRRGLLGELSAALFSMPLHSRGDPISVLLRRTRRWEPVWLRPAFFSAEAMIDAMQNTTTDCIHFMCHSNELTEETSPYLSSKEAVDRCFARLTACMEWVAAHNWRFLTLCEYGRIHGTATKAAG